MANIKAPNDRMRDRKITVAFPLDRWPELEAVAKDQGLSVSSFARNAVYLRIADIKRAA